MVRINSPFWSQGKTDKYYIVKQKKGHQPLSLKEAINDHIANTVYSLFNVITPNLYIGIYKENLCLISEVLPGYRDLIEWLGGEEVFDHINHHSDVSACVETYKKYENNLSIQGKEKLLAAAIILEDCDLIGAGLRNLGLIKQGDRHHLIKIDPSDGFFNLPKHEKEKQVVEFRNALSWENALFYAPFSTPRFCNNPRSILGNLHFNEFFHDIDKNKLKDELRWFISLDDESIKSIVVRDEYIKILNTEEGIEYLENIAECLIAKKEILKQFVEPLEERASPSVLPEVFNSSLKLSEPLEMIHFGASKPIKVKQISSSEQDILKNNSELSLLC